ncbi:MAG: bifunctional phosphoribosylaminoimidazolecarboxamide formyltransferase/IMP cyclohydrolase PurH [Bacteroidetes bacterium MED-G13]|nr:MAG: bifunctional phosphoribosylaminoimidazolecarboxamide formyltransferase/IMP cyclohydrolase PurH [Bacteroidetes bacterium MED-G13]
MSNLKIKSALISVFSKKGIAEIIHELVKNNVIIYSTGGTYDFIKNLGHNVIKVEDITTFPSIFGGRVKTLHPKIFGGILYRRENEKDNKEKEEFDIPQIDLVIVDLYPFEETVISGASETDVIEKIDIGGISLIRAAAKNYNDVTCISSKKDYKSFLSIIKNSDCEISLNDRKKFASNAFKISSNYDHHINNYFSEVNESSLRYGENPHQNGTFIGNLNEIFTKMHGKELSYNNLLDIDAALDLMKEFKDEKHTFAILKHNNACGISTRESLKKSYHCALEADPVSAFGGILICNSKMDVETAEIINKLFCEVVISPKFDEESLTMLKSKKNRIILKLNSYPTKKDISRTCLNGSLHQSVDNITDSLDILTYPTKIKPNADQIDDLLFASKISKNTKSNTIVLVKNKQLLASGTGQTSRVDALNQAIEKAEKFGFDLNGASMASDAFFPFPDCVEIAHKKGINSIIQPGGSIKDNLSIDYCNENRIGMIFTGIRHFKH